MYKLKFQTVCSSQIWARNIITHGATNVITDNLQRNYYISIRISYLHSDLHISNILAAIAFVALDTRLGCLEPNLAPDSEPQRMIDSVQTQIECMFEMDMRFSLWKWVSTPTWRKFVRAADLFAE